MTKPQMTKLEVASIRMARIEQVLASMARAIEQEKADVDKLDWDAIGDLGVIAQELEAVETFWLEASARDSAPSMEPTTYVEMGSNAIVTVVHIEGRIAYLQDGAPTNLRDLWRPPWLIKAEQERAAEKDPDDTNSAALDVGVQ